MGSFWLSSLDQVFEFVHTKRTFYRSSTPLIQDHCLIIGLLLHARIMQGILTLLDSASGRITHAFIMFFFSSPTIPHLIIYICLLPNGHINYVLADIYKLGEFIVNQWGGTINKYKQILFHSTNASVTGTSTPMNVHHA